jgi:gliding motility associated protien GldN
MNKTYLAFFLSFLFVISFAQENNQENRQVRDWDNSNQTTYYQEGQSKTYLNEDGDEVIKPGATEFDGFNDNRSKVDPSTVETHRHAAVWADNSTIVSDEKTGYYSHIPYVYVSEDDVLWAKRVRKRIDLRITQNHPLYYPVEVKYPHYNGFAMEGGTEEGRGGQKNFSEVLSGIDARKNLFQILRDAATTVNPETGAPIVSTYNMSLTRKFTNKEVVPNFENNYPNAFGFTYPDFDDDDQEVTFYEWWKPTHIVGYWVEEEIFFDKRRAKIDFRYISITPIARHPNYNSGQDVELPTFYFPEIRQLLANHKVFPLNGNIAQRMSFDEFFHRKHFASHIVKETNVYNRSIQDYITNSLQRLLEGEQIREQIRRYESDMWNY